MIRVAIDPQDAAQARANPLVRLGSQMDSAVIRSLRVLVGAVEENVALHYHFVPARASFGSLLQVSTRRTCTDSGAVVFGVHPDRFLARKLPICSLKSAFGPVVNFLPKKKGWGGTAR